MNALAALFCCALLAQDGAGDKRRLTSAPDGRVELDFQHYYKTRELKTALSNLATAYAEFVQLESLGKSRGGEDLWLVRLSLNEGVDPGTKPALFVSASQSLPDVHGTELALSSLVEFLQNNARDPRVGRALKETTIYFVPCVNPDLRTAVLSELETGSGRADEGAPRVDLERNYPVGWSPFQAAGAQGGGRPGPYPLSEPEARWISSFLVQHENIGVVVGFAPLAGGARPGSAAKGPPGEPASLQRLLEGAPASGGAELDFTGRADAPRGNLDDFAYGQLGALPVRLRCGVADPSGLALPPVDEIEPLAHRVADSLLSLTEALPRLSIVNTSVLRMKDLWQVEVTIANTGSLRTQSGLGSDRRAVAVPRLSVAGGKLSAAGMRVGREDVYVPLAGDGGGYPLLDLDGGESVRVRVLVLAPQETALEITASSPRAGSASTSLVLR